MSITFLFLGLVLILMLNEQETESTINSIQLVLIIVLLTLVLWLLTMDVEVPSINVDYEIFFPLLAISMLILKELMHRFLSPYLQKRMTLLFIVLFVPLMIVFLQRIINILNMSSG